MSLKQETISNPADETDLLLCALLHNSTVVNVTEVSQVEAVLNRITTDDDLRAMKAGIPSYVIRQRFLQVGCDLERLQHDLDHCRVTGEDEVPWDIMQNYTVHWPDGCVYKNAWNG